jgi:hypothetical protein
VIVAKNPQEVIFEIFENIMSGLEKKVAGGIT